MATQRAKKISELPVATNTAYSDSMLIVKDPGTTPVTSTITNAYWLTSLMPNVGNSALDGSVRYYANTQTLYVDNLGMYRQTTIPANTTATGSLGMFAFNNTHLYICTSNNTWRRVAIDTF